MPMREAPLVKILQVSQAYYPFLAAGGPPMKVRAIATKLAARGHCLTVLTADHGIAHLASDVVKLERCEWGWRGEEAGVETIYLRSLLRYRSLTLNPDVIRFCQSRIGDTDVVHLYGLYDLLGPIVGHYCSRRSVPYVLEPIGMYHPIVRSLRLKRLYHRLFGKRLVNGARYLIATSQQEKDELAAGGNPAERIVIRRNGIDALAAIPERGRFRSAWSIPADASLVLFLGRLISKKSPELLIDAFARWQSQTPRKTRAVLVLAGPEEESSYVRELKDRCERLQLDGRVLFTGPLYGESKWAAYRDADVFVLPSQNENFGNTAAEAAACGTPVIVTEKCGIAPIVRGRAGIVVEHSYAAVADALETIFADPAPRESFREGCAEMTRELSWDEPIEQLETLYARCLAPGGAQ
jgi:glycosyltransferase involved in cell wall biosynthesis